MSSYAAQDKKDTSPPSSAPAASTAPRDVAEVDHKSTAPEAKTTAPAWSFVRIDDLHRPEDAGRLHPDDIRALTHDQSARVIKEVFKQSWHLVKHMGTARRPAGAASP